MNEASANTGNAATTTPATAEESKTGAAGETQAEVDEKKRLANQKKK